MSNHENLRVTWQLARLRNGDQRSPQMDAAQLAALLALVSATGPSK